MITLTYKDINNPLLDMALNKILNTANLPMKVAYNIAKIADKVKGEVSVARKLYTSILSKYVQLKENGQPMMTETGQLLFKEGEGHKEAYEKEFSEFLEVMFKIPRHKILLSQVGSLALTPAEALAVEPIFSELEDVSGDSEQTA